MLRFQGSWIYSKKDNCYFTLFEGVILLRASATYNGDLDTSYRSVDWEKLTRKDASRLMRLANTLRREYGRAQQTRCSKVTHAHVLIGYKP
jgi:hypothetical protein